MESVLILGASSDIADAIAREFAKNKHQIILAGRGIDKLHSLKSDYHIRYQAVVHLVEFDAVQFDTHESFYKQLPITPTIVVCVFGYLGDQQLGQQNFKEAKSIIDINYTGAVSILNVVANDFERRNTGTIIGISSVAGERGRQSNYLYGSAKAGFTAYLSGLRNRLFKSHVHVITVKPGFVNTKMTFGLKLPKPITAQPSQVGAAVYQSWKVKTNVLYVLWMWRWIMMIIKNIPEPVFKKLKL